MHLLISQRRGQRRIESSMEIRIEGIPIIHSLLQRRLSSLRLRRFVLRSADPILCGGEFQLQPQRTLLCLLRCDFHRTQLSLQAEQCRIEAGEPRRVRYVHRTSPAQLVSLRVPPRFARVERQSVDWPLAVHAQSLARVVRRCGARWAHVYFTRRYTQYRPSTAEYALYGNV